MLIWDFAVDDDGVDADDVEPCATELNWLANTLATSDATVKSDGGNWAFDNDNEDDEDSFELSVWRRLFADNNVCSEFVWDWTSGENIGFSNIPRLCWTDDAKKYETKKMILKISS